MISSFSKIYNIISVNFDRLKLHLLFKFVYLTMRIKFHYTELSIKL